MRTDNIEIGVHNFRVNGLILSTLFWFQIGIVGALEGLIINKVEIKLGRESTLIFTFISHLEM